MGSTNQATSAFHPCGVIKKSNSPYNYMDYGVETIKRRPDCVWLVGHRSACGCRLSLRPI